MFTTEEIEEFRADAESRMTSRVTIRRIGAPVTVDGLEVPGWTTVYTGLPFRLVPKGARAVTIGGVTFEEATARGDMPAATTTNLADDDVIALTAGEWAGSFWRIVEAVKGDQQTARRVPIVEVPQPEGWV